MSKYILVFLIGFCFAILGINSNEKVVNVLPETIPFKVVYQDTVYVLIPAKEYYNAKD